MNEQNEHIKNLLYNRYTGELDDSRFLISIQDILRANGGKLYKYCRFDKEGYSITNLQNQELYCSKPSKFNDPFDCRIGIDIYSLAKDHFNSFAIGMEEDFKVLKAVFNNKMILDECSPKMQPIMKLLLENKEFFKVIELCSKQQFNDGQLVELLQQYPNVIKLLISTFYNAALEQTGYDQNGISIELFMGIFNNLDSNQLVINNDEIDIPASCVKALGIKDDVDEISLLKLITKQIQPENYNILDAMDKQLYQLDENLRQIIDQNFYVGCLSEDPKNVLMWSHYGESHSGFCVEYDFNQINLQDEKIFLCPVIYSENRPPIPWNITINKNDVEQRRNEYELLLSMLTKDSTWSYEKEWRILRFQNTQNEKALLPFVSCVYIGANCDQLNVDKILKITNTLHIPVKKINVDRSLYKLHALPL